MRKTASKTADGELMASIIAHGLINPLTVTEQKGGKFHVIAGARRLAALQALQKDGQLTKDHAVNCQSAANDDAAEVSLAENVVRQAMHSADGFEAFAKLATAKPPMPAAKIAERFGVAEKHVLQRLKLARVAPQLLREYRAEKLSLECLMAFTITDDHKRQVAVFKGLQGWEQNSDRAIRDKLTKEKLKSDDRLVKYVGLAAYRKAGGAVTEDMFGKDVYIENADLLRKLAEDKTKATLAELEAEGWGWVLFADKEDYQFVSKCEISSFSLADLRGSIAALTEFLALTTHALQAELVNDGCDGALVNLGCL